MIAVEGNKEIRVCVGTNDKKFICNVKYESTPDSSTFDKQCKNKIRMRAEMCIGYLILHHKVLFLNVLVCENGMHV